ncbi:TVP38/TMEM64 family protein [Nocardioides marmoraquaticus]
MTPRQTGGVSDDQAPPLGRLPRLRLVLLVLVLGAAAAVFGFGDVVSVAEVRATVDRAGPLAPAAYVVVGALLAAVLVPGPVLAGASGLLFGAVLGTVVTLGSTLGTALVALVVGRAAGRDGARAVLGVERASRTEGLLERRGLLVVAAQRLTPGVPDAPMSYAFGALGVRTWQVVLGTLVGSAPRAFAYTAIGSSLDDPTSPVAIAGVVVWLLVAVVGLEVARRAWVHRGRTPAP